jgi:hypothetical protein
VKIALRLFLSSAAFTGVLSAAYWFTSHDPAGAVLLAFMTAALLVIALYMFVAERNAGLFADDPDATPAQVRGERVGTFVLHSPAPFWIGLALAGLMLGLVVAPAAAGLGMVALCFLGALLIVRSR